MSKSPLAVWRGGGREYTRQRALHGSNSGGRGHGLGEKGRSLICLSPVWGQGIVKDDAGSAVQVASPPQGLGMPPQRIFMTSCRPCEPLKAWRGEESDRSCVLESSVW